nr:zonadhesin [Dasypus novemcinctus]
MECNFENDSKPLCGWTQESEDDGDWTRKKGSARSDIATAKGGYPNGEGAYLYLNSSAIRYGGVVRLRSPLLSVSGPLCVHFAYQVFGRPWGAQLKLLLLPGLWGRPRQLLWKQTDTQSATWMPVIITVPTGLARSRRLIFEAVRGNKAYLDFALDAVSVRRGTCNQVCVMQTCSFDILSDLCGWSLIPTVTGAGWVQQPGSSGKLQAMPKDDFSKPGKGFYLLLDPKNAKPKQKAVLLSPLSLSSGCLSLTFHYTLWPESPGAGLHVFAEVLGSIQKDILFSGKPGPNWQPAVVKYTGHGQIQFIVVGVYGETPEPAVAVDALAIAPCGELHYIYVKADKESPVGNSVRLMSWPFCATETICVDFSYRLFGPGEGSALQLLLAGTGGTAAKSLWARVGSQGPAWQHASVTIPSGQLQPWQLILEGITGTNVTFDISVGFILIHPGVCPAPVPTVLPTTTATSKTTLHPQKPTTPTAKSTLPTKKTTVPTETTAISTVPTEKTTVSTVPTKKTTVPTETTAISTVPTEKTTVSTVPTKKTTVPTETTAISTVPTEKTTVSTVPTEKITVPTETTAISTVPTEKTTVSTVPAKKITVPTETTAISTVPTEKTTVSTVPTEKTTIPTVPTEKTTVSAVPTEKTTVSTVPIETTTIPAVPTKKITVPTETTAISTVPTEKTIVPTETTTIPTVPTEKTTVSTVPTEKTTIPTVPTEKTTVSTVPTEKTMVSTVPTETTTIPTVPTEKTTVSTVPTEKTTVSAIPTEKTTVPTETTAISTVPIETTTVPTEKTSTPTEKPTVLTKKHPAPLTPTPSPTLQPVGPAVWSVSNSAAQTTTVSSTETPAPFPVKCPPRAHLESCACPASCQSPKPRCELPCKAGCVCNPGFVLSGSRCIRSSSCNCFYKNSVYKAEQEWFGPSCTERCRCSGSQVKCWASQCGTHRVCQQRNGQYGCYPQGNATCTVYGDPHYLTFDWRPLTFTGKCTYILVQPCDNSTDPYFRVAAKNEERGQGDVSCLSRVYVTLPQTTVTLLRGRQTLVGGQQVTLPAVPFQGVSLSLSGRFVALQTAFGLRVQWDGDQQLSVTLPSTFFSKLCGICGNYDGDSDNDNRRPDGLPAADDQELGNSWQTEEDGGAKCENNQENPASCGKSLQSNLTRSQLCGQLINTQGPFGTCLPQLRDSFYYNNCLSDLCNFQGQRQSLCLHMAALTEACQAAGHTVTPWRSPQFCPLACPPNSKYTLCAKSCPDTCHSGFSALSCPDRCVEGCECLPGFVLSGLQCVPRSQCGCLHSSGNYYQVGQEWYLPGCKQRCYCDKDSKIRCVRWKCEHPYVCGTEDGIFGCHTQATGTCVVSGVPHLQTFDGALHHFMGSCAYTLTRTCWSGHPEASFVVSITMGFRGGNLDLSYIRAVHVQVFNIKLKLFRGRKVMLNGRRMALPLWSAQGRVSVALSGSFVLLQTNFGLWIYYDGYHLVEVIVPYYYTGQLCGLCGNFNNNSLDDSLRPDGQPAEDSVQLEVAWMATDLSEPGCYAVGGKPPSCPGNSDTWSKKCEVLTSPLGPFSQCHKLVSPRASFDTCVYGQCGSRGDPLTLCHALKTYAILCAQAGQPLAWRNSTLCPPRCPPGSSYSPCASPCPVTCLSTSSPTNCPSRLRCTEGCECQKGLVLSDTTCVPVSQCGCTLQDGTYHPVGKSWYSNQACSQLCTCSSQSQVSCNHSTCSSWERCWVHNGLLSCRRIGMGMCHVSGDPHYVSFDGSYHSFRGTCTYILTQVCHPTMDSFSFKITAKNEKWGGQMPTFYISQVNIYIYSARVTLEKGHRVLIDGRPVSLPSKNQIYGVSITSSGTYTKFATHFGLFVTYDGSHLLEIQVPQSYYNRVCGMCGNFNGEKEDDLMMPSDDLARNDIEFGNSWQDRDDTDPDCHPDKQSQVDSQVMLSPTCKPEDLAQAHLHCQRAFRDPGWAQCATKVVSRPYLLGCIHAFCELGNLRHALCDTLQDFGAACQAQGLSTPKWRNSSFCPLECPAHSSYTSCAPTCQPSCQDLEGRCKGSKSKSTCLEGCTCESGYVLSEDQCVPKNQCTCRDTNGFSLPVGMTWLSSDCTQSCTCTRGVIQCRNFQCPSGSHCQLTSKGINNCVPNWLDHCSVFGDPHYRTFDGLSYRFRGHMTYVLIKTVPVLPDGMEALLVEGRNKMYLPWSPVYLHEVLVTVYGYRIQLRPGLELVVNGEKVAVPYQPNDHLQVSLRAHRLYLTTDFKLGVSFDGSSNAVITLPSVYQGLVRGLCGNFDRNLGNEFMLPSGAITQDPKAFGNSWVVKSDKAIPARWRRALQEEEAGEGAAGFRVSGCSPEQLALVNSSQACRVLGDPQGPFAACHQTVAPEPFQEHCQLDLCAARSPGEREELRCRVLGGYAAICQQAGATLARWRHRTRCALACPANTVYQSCMTACPASCASPRAPGDCDGPCVEGCASVPGYIFSGARSLPVADCGCTRDGVYYQLGDSFVTRDCSQRCTCARRGVLRCEPFGCGAGETCTLANFTRGCFRESPCLQNPCQNDGRCRERGASFACECELGYAGDLCSEPWDTPAPGKPEASNHVAVLLGMVAPIVVAALAVIRERLHRKRPPRVRAQSQDRARLADAGESRPRRPALGVPRCGGCASKAGVLPFSSEFVPESTSKDT